MEENKEDIHGYRYTIISFIIIFIAIGINLYFDPYRYSVNIVLSTAPKLGYLFGASIFLSIISFLLWRFVFQRKKGMGMLCFSILLLIVSINEVSNWMKEDRPGKEAAKYMATSLKKATKGQQIEPSKISEEKYGQLTPLIKIIETYALEVQEDSHAMQRKIEQQGLATILSPSNLASSTAISKARARLRNIRKITEEYENKFIQKINGVENQIKNLDMSEEYLYEALTGYRKSKTEKLQYYSEHSKIKKAMFSKIDDVLVFFSGIPAGDYSFEGEKTLFANKDDLARFNMHIQELTALVQKEASLLDKMQQVFKNEINEFKRMAR